MVVIANQGYEFKMFAYGSGSKSVVLLLEMQILRLRRHLNQKFWGEGPAICSLTSSPGKSEVCLSLRSTKNLLKSKKSAEARLVNAYTSRKQFSKAHGIRTPT